MLTSHLLFTTMFINCTYAYDFVWRAGWPSQVLSPLGVISPLTTPFPNNDLGIRCPMGSILDSLEVELEW
jgi:hypothetical protein